MIYIFGNAVCPSCELETRFLCEHKESEEDSFLLLGEKIESAEAIETSEQSAVCDYCQASFSLHAAIDGGRIQAFLNDAQREAVESGEIELPPAEESAGLKMEREKRLSQFREAFKSPFKMHPLAPGSVIRAESGAWKVERAHRKESVERDLSKRMSNPFLEEYWYEVAGAEGEKRWITVVQAQDENAVLSLEPPALKENEVVHEITDTLFKTQKISEERFGECHVMRAYQHLSGVRLLVFSKGKYGEELELDAFGRDMEDALALAKSEIGAEE